MGSQVLEGQLELLRLAAEQDLDDDGGVERDGDVGRHGGRSEADRRNGTEGGQQEHEESDGCRLAATKVNEELERMQQRLRTGAGAGSSAGDGRRRRWREGRPGRRMGIVGV